MNGMNPQLLIRLMGMKNQFEKDHPGVASFFSTIMRTGIEEGSVIEVTITKPDGTTLTTNMKVNASDFEMIDELKNLRG